MWKQWLLVFVGGGFGSLLRFAFQRIIASGQSNFPWATLGANLLGCFLFGIIAGYFTQQGSLKSDTALLLLVGFCGGLTTFSSFIYEGEQMLQHSFPLQFFLYNGLSFGLGLLLLYLGFILLK